MIIKYNTIWKIFRYGRASSYKITMFCKLINGNRVDYFECRRTKFIDKYPGM